MILYGRVIAPRANGGYSGSASLIEGLRLIPRARAEAGNDVQERIDV